MGANFREQQLEVQYEQLKAAAGVMVRLLANSRRAEKEGLWQLLATWWYRVVCAIPVAITILVILRASPTKR